MSREVEGITKRVCSFSRETTYERLPQAVIDRAKLHVLDTLGVTIAGSASEAGQIVREHVESLQAQGQATVVCGHRRTAPQHAALVNGVMGHALDYDDFTVESMLGHPSVAVLPAALAVAEEVEASGAELIAAYVVGCEIACKLGLCFNPELFQRGWPATCVLGTFGAAVAAAKLLELDAQAFESAVGIAASQASGVKANVGTMTKAYHAGHAAENGVVAASLAARSFRAMPDILETADGFAEVFGVHAEESVLSTLGDPYDMVDPGYTIKRFPSCGATHAGIEAALQLMADHGLGVGDVAEVECLVSPHAKNVLVFAQPSTGLEGKFSMEYCLAVALSRGRPTIGDFTDEAVADPAVGDVLSRITVDLDPELARQGYMNNGAPVGATVAITTTNGERVSLNVPAPAWDGRSVPATDDVVKKFYDCADSTGEGVDGLDQLVDDLLNLERLDNAQALLERCRRGWRMTKPRTRWSKMSLEA